jgi:hypothetical protein
MPAWLTIEEAAELFRERGVTVRYRGKQVPPSLETIGRWCQAGLLKAERKGEGKRGIWLIDPAAAAVFTPPKGGRPQDEAPSQAALAQRESRRRRHASTIQQPEGVTGDTKETGTEHLDEQVREPAAPALDLAGVPCPVCERRGLHHPNKPESREKDTSRVRCRFCGRIALASEIAALAAAHEAAQEATKEAYERHDHP